MRNFFVTTVIALALIMGATGAAPVAHAYTDSCTTSGQSCITVSGGSGTCVQTEIGISCSASGASEAVTAAQTADAAAQAAAAAKTATSYQTNSTDTAFNPVMSAIAGLFAWLVGAAALALDYSVYYTVINMGTYIHNLTAIGVTWRILRDIGNIMLIFGFLAIGISVILNTERIGYGKKMLPMLLVAAVFLNFSLFFAEAIIDTGNLFATQFYSQINGGTLPKTTASGAIAAADGTAMITGKAGISTKLMSQLGLQAMYGNAINNKDIFTGSNPWYVGFMAALLFLITAFVMFSLAFILIARFVMLVFLIILAPVGFAGLAVPQLSKRAGQWWSALFTQTITAPVLLLLLYIALAVITDKQFLIPGSPTGFVANADLPGFAGYIISFTIAIGLMLAVTISAKKLSAFGAGHATKLAGALTFGMTAAAGRVGVGTVVGRGLLGNRFIKRGAVSDNKIIKYGSRALSFTGKRMQNRTFDVRNMPGAKAGLSSMGVDAGTPSSLTAKQLQEKQYGLKPTKEWFRESSKEHEKSAADLTREEILATGALAAIQKELKKMSDDEIAEFKGIRKGQDKFVQSLSPTAYANLKKNKNLLDSEKKVIGDSWDRQFASHATSRIALDRMSEDERVALGGTTLAKPTVYESLTADDFDNIRSAKLQPAEKATIATYVQRMVAPGAVPPPSAPPTLQADLIAAAANPKFKAYYSIP